MQRENYWPNVTGSVGKSDDALNNGVKHQQILF